MKKIAILGSGAFGFVMAKIVSEKHFDKDLFLFDIQKEHIDHINKTRNHPIFHKGIYLAQHIHATTNLKSAIVGANLIILAIPSKLLRSALKDLKKFLSDGVVLLNVAKGLEISTNLRVSEIVSEELRGLDFEFCSLSGGMIAGEVASEHPLCADVACQNLSIAKKVAMILENHHLRLETTTDVVGVELAGAFKNVIAVGAGIFDGLGYAESSKSAFISAASFQMQKLAIALGAKNETFGPGSYAWFGDLMTTCFGNSRNREFGELIGKGMKPSDAIIKMERERKSVEGFITSNVVVSMGNKQGVDISLLVSLYDVLYNGIAPEKFVFDFISNRDA